MISLSGSMQASPAYWLNPVNGNTYTIGVRSPETAVDSLDALLRTPVVGRAIIAYLRWRPFGGSRRRR